MKVGTDAVLLGAWATTGNASRILEVGTGCGVIALVLAQRSNPGARIDAIDIDKKSVEEALENARRSPWSTQVSVHGVSMQEWAPGYSYDLIVTNPPFFRRSLLPPDPIRSQARHSITLAPAELLHHAQRLLTPDGKLCVILPFAEGNDFIRQAGEHLLFLRRQTAFFSRPGKPQERWLLEFSPSRGAIQQEQLTLYSDGGNWSDAYRALTHDFYLDN